MTNCNFHFVIYIPIYKKKHNYLNRGYYSILNLISTISRQCSHKKRENIRFNIMPKAHLEEKRYLAENKCSSTKNEICVCVCELRHASRRSGLPLRIFLLRHLQRLVLFSCQALQSYTYMYTDICELRTHISNARIYLLQSCFRFGLAILSAVLDQGNEPSYIIVEEVVGIYT